ncbi:MAG: 2-amino-4-hydroxy-6-hydroxymethyldihydropteridine diphosphokinase [Muribaculaceae bacterium]|nr:2-amino-4-hydroxy-6-hydroxymethyldihydropteridine diphosphokinase [Muribaculaceae bacterium]
MTAHINIGSNLGHRAEQIARAVSLLDPSVGRVERVSAPFMSAAWGYESSGEFINVGVNVSTRLDAAAIVDRLQAIERTIDPDGCHRDADGNYADRRIDLDLICLGDADVSEENVTVPHPRMHLREFVLVPMAEIMPGWTHPRLGITVEKILENLRNKTGGQAV